jgi:hypothetical protein
MTWEIVVGIIALVGFLTTIGTMVGKLVHTLTRLDLTLKALIAEDKANAERSKADRKEIRRQLDDHELRIHDLELKGE